MISPESFEKKLYIPRNVEGEPNSEEIEEIRKVEDKFKQRPEFVGLTPFGSVIRGYSKEGSDIDLNVVYDSSNFPGGLAPGDARVYFEDLTKETSFKKGEHIHIFKYIDANEKFFLDALKRGSIAYPSFYLNSLSRMVTGDKINTYRESARAKIDSLDQVTKKAIMEKSLVGLVQWDMANFLKISERVPGIDMKETEASIKKLWHQRLEKLWGEWQSE